MNIPYNYNTLHLAHSFLGALKNNNAIIHTNYGFIRRYGMLLESIDYINSKIESQNGEPLSLPTAARLSLHLNSFYLHLRGCLDNLSFTLTYEFELSENTNPKSLRNFCDLFGNDFLIALRNKKPVISQYIKKHRNWFKELKCMRDAGAHRIPLSFFTSVLTPEENKEHSQILKDYHTAVKKLATLKIKESKSDLDNTLDNALELLFRSNEIGKFEPIFLAYDYDGGEVKYAPKQIGIDLEMLDNISKMIFSEISK